MSCHKVRIPPPERIEIFGDTSDQRGQSNCRATLSFGVTDEIACIEVEAVRRGKKLLCAFGIVTSQLRTTGQAGQGGIQSFRPSEEIPCRRSNEPLAAGIFLASYDVWSPARSRRHT